jgi:hypothetical protein
MRSVSADFCAAAGAIQASAAATTHACHHQVRLRI